MTTDQEFNESEREYERALRKYRAHYFTRLIVYGLTGGLMAYLFRKTVSDPWPESSSLADWAIYLGALIVLFFLIDWALDVAFKRKSRPWRLTRDPADRKPSPRP